MLPDGSGRLHAQLTGEATAVWQTILSTLARPVPDTGDGEPDRRSPGQRRHDALLDAGRRLLRAGTLPDAGGAPATVLLALTLDQVESRTGLATTAHGGAVSVPQALRIAAEADIVPVVLERRRRSARLRADPPHRQHRATPRPRRPGWRLFDSRAVIGPRIGAKPTTWSRGWTAVAPTWTISLWSADFTIASTANAAGPATSPTAYPTGDHPAGSTPLKPRAGTPPPHSPELHRVPDTSADLTSLGSLARRCGLPPVSLQPCPTRQSAASGSGSGEVSAATNASRHQERS